MVQPVLGALRKSPSRGRRFFVAGLFLWLQSFPVYAEPMRLIATPALAELASVLARQSGIEAEVSVNDHLFALKSVAADQADVALTAQPLTQGDRAIFTAFPGRSAVQLPIGYEAICPMVHPDNPAPSISEGQLIALMVDVHCAESFQSPVATWGDLGAGGNWRQEPLSILVPDKVNPTREGFEELLLGLCDPRPELQTYPTDALTERNVANDPKALGIVREARVGGGVRILPVIASPSVVPVTPTLESIRAGTYPFVRKVWVVLNQRPRSGTQESEFVAFIQSATGQAVIDRRGFYPVPELADENRLKTGRPIGSEGEESVPTDLYRRLPPKSVLPGEQPLPPE